MYTNPFICSIAFTLLVELFLSIVCVATKKKK